MARPRRYASGRNIAIGNRAGLARLVREVIATRFGGSLARAARESGTSRALLRRIQAGAQRSVRTDNVQALRQLAGRHFVGVESTLVEAPARSRLDAFDAWLETAIDAAQLGLLATGGKAPKDPLRAANHRRLMEFHALVRRLQHDFEAEWRPLFRAVTRRHYRARTQLAFARVVAPLLDSLETGGIERAYAEFSRAELRAFVKAGVTRERLLLKRSNDVDRAQTAPEPRLTLSDRRRSRSLPPFSGVPTGLLGWDDFDVDSDFEPS